MNKTINIALCDDDSQALDVLESHISAYSKEHGININTDRYLSGEELLNKNNATDIYDIIFMDIYLGSDARAKTGTDIIRSLKTATGPQVVFMTTSTEHAIEAFSLNATHYILKPLTYTLVAEALSRCLSYIGVEEYSALSIRTKQGVVSIPSDNIIYIEVSNKQSTIHTPGNSIQTYTALDSLYEMLDKHVFMRAQRSFIVNMHCIDEFMFDRIILSDKTEIMLSRGNRANLKQQYQTFLFDLARRRAL